MVATTTKDLDLTPFCGSGARYAIGNPFVIGRWKYASDATIVVRIPTDDPESEDLVGVPRNCDSFFVGIDGDGFAAMPEYKPITKDGPCIVCLRSGCLHSGCLHSGTIEPKVKCCECGHEHESQCWNCVGKGSGVLPHHQVICGLSISVKQLHRIGKLPGPVSCKASSAKGQLLLFRFSGGQGVVMEIWT